MDHEPRHPKSLREIPNSWWDVALDGQTHHVDLSKFTGNAILSFKQACYRNAAMRGRRVTLYHPLWHTIYIRTFPVPGQKPTIETQYAVETPWPDLGPDIPVVLFPAARLEAIPAAAAGQLPAEALAFLRSAGFVVEQPDASPPRPVVAAPREPTPEELLEVELTWIRAKCTCGTEDLSHHPADCPVWS